jgi:WD40 repeat protein
LIAHAEFPLPQATPGEWKRAFVVPGGESVILGDGAVVTKLTLDAQADAIGLAENARLLAVAKNGQSVLIAEPGVEGKGAVRVISLAKKPGGKEPSFPSAEPGGAVLSPDGARALVCVGNGKTWFDLRRSLAVGVGPSSGGKCLAMQPGGNLVALGVDDGPGLLAFPGRAVRGLNQPYRRDLPSAGRQSAVADFSPDGQTVVFGIQSGSLEVYDVASESWRAGIPVSDQPVIAVVWGKGDRVAASTADGRIVLVDVSRRRILGQTKWEADGKILSLGFAKEKSRLVVVPDKGVARIFDSP